MFDHLFTGQFLWSKSWKNGKKFCESVGSSWAFQTPSQWVAQINAMRRLEFHYTSWLEGSTDKQNHVFWFISAGPGCGKSRCLDEFPNILRQAASEITGCDGLQKRVQEMLVFKVSFENGTKSNGDISSALSIPARMAYQMQGSSMLWSDFYVSDIGKTITFSAIYQQLVEICHVPDVRDLSILILIDGLQEATSVQENLKVICDLINDSPPFVMIAFSATIQIPIADFLVTSGQPCTILTLPPICEPGELGEIYEIFPKYEDRQVFKFMIRDMGGHGRALEYLLRVMNESKGAVFKPNSIMNTVKERLKEAYLGWNPFSKNEHATAVLISIICGCRLPLRSIIPGTDLTVDRIVQIGLFRHDPVQERLSVAYVWMLMFSDRVTVKELHSLISVDYDSLRDIITHGSSASLSFQSFAEFWCNFRAVRSRCFGDGTMLNWSDFHSGATFSSGCNFNFVNRHLSFARAVQQFGTKSSSTDLIKLFDDSESCSREKFHGKVLLNCAGAQSGDSTVPLLLLDGKLCMESHECKRYETSIMKALEIKKEREKAADPDDCFLVVCPGKVEINLDELPRRTAVINDERLETYFGPFAGRACAFKFFWSG